MNTPRTEYVPLGVSFAEYSRPLPVPRDLLAIPRPRIGYIGVLKKTLDWALLRHLSARHPEWNFVFLGPRAPHPEIHEPIRDLERRPNVHFLPARPTTELVPYPQHLDVCIMPYVLNPYARYGYPLKCHEQRIQTALKPSEQAMERIVERKAVARRHNWDDLVGAIATRMEERLQERTDRVAGTDSRAPRRTDMGRASYQPLT